MSNERLVEYVALEYQIKKHMDDIIQNAFFTKDYKTLQKIKYKIFKLAPKCKNAYIPEVKTAIIYITQRYQDEENSACLILHQTAHHICNELYNSMEHDDKFYMIFRKLLYSAIDLKKMRSNSIFHISEHFYDYTKIVEIGREYIRRRTHVKINNGVMLEIYNAHNNKDILHRDGFYWNNFRYCWYKEFKSEAEARKEVNKYLSCGIKKIYIRPLHVFPLKPYSL